MIYKALTYVNLPPDTRKAPGELISEDELGAAGQTAEDIQALVDQGAIGGEDDPINDAHAPVDVPPGIVASDGGEGS